MKRKGFREHFLCPCCKSPSLSQAGDFEICNICWWEDDGQDDTTTPFLTGGPNGTYTLLEAQQNFKKFGIMYSPEDPSMIDVDAQNTQVLRANLYNAYQVAMETKNVNDCAKAAALNRELTKLHNN